MALLVCMGAVLQCSSGTASSSLTVPSQNRTYVNTVPPAANIEDGKSLVNIMSFGMCTARGTPPVPRVPVTPASWVPGSPTVLIANKPALNDSSTLKCSWNGGDQGELRRSGERASAVMNTPARRPYPTSGHADTQLSCVR